MWSIVCKFLDGHWTVTGSADFPFLKFAFCFPYLRQVLIDNYPFFPSKIWSSREWFCRFLYDIVILVAVSVVFLPRLQSEGVSLTWGLPLSVAKLLRDFNVFLACCLPKN